jgi:metal-dependent amidase/aminoacylase/carboxypeptidase family protein
VQRLEQPSLGAEDFAELLHDVPGTMFRLGVAGPEGCAPLHSGFFNPEERALGVGVQVLTAAMLAWTPTP